MNEKNPKEHWAPIWDALANKDLMAFWTNQEFPQPEGITVHQLPYKGGVYWYRPQLIQRCGVISREFFERYAAKGLAISCDLATSLAIGVFGRRDSQTRWIVTEIAGVRLLWQAPPGQEKSSKEILETWLPGAKMVVTGSDPFASASLPLLHLQSWKSFLAATRDQKLRVALGLCLGLAGICLMFFVTLRGGRFWMQMLTLLPFLVPAYIVLRRGRP